MYARRLTQPKPRQSTLKSFPAPVDGWISNRALAVPNAPNLGQGAAILDNFFPTSTSVQLRRGKYRYAVLGDGTQDTGALFSYNNGDNKHLFAANTTTIYDITNVQFAYDILLTDDDDNVFTDGNGNVFGWGSTEFLNVMEGFTGGNWIVTQFATTGGVFLIGVNGQDTGFIYDGTDFWPNLAGGMWYLALTSDVSPFTAGETITGSVSSVTGKVYRDDTNRLVISGIVEQTETWTIPYVSGSAEFEVGSTLSGATSHASATISAITPGTTQWALHYDTGTVAFTVGDTVTGGTSAATGVIISIDGTTASGTLFLGSVTGTFVDGEPLTDTSGGAADCDGTQAAIYSGTLTITGLTGSFVSGEPITGGDGVAVSGASETYVSGGPFRAGETIAGNLGGSGVVDSEQENAVPGIAFPDGLTSADMSFVWTYANRLWFAQKNTMNAYYLNDVDSVGGDATIFPLSGVFARGGTLLFGQTWSLEGGASGGLSEQCIFCSDEGEVAVYQGQDPTDANNWGKVGLYRIGKPLGNRAFMRGGGDIAIATSVGLVPLSKAMQLDVTALNTASVSYNIADAWSDATALRGLTDWQCEIWPELKMAIVSPPYPQGASEPVMFVANTDTGAWGRYTGWHGLCLEVFNGELYFGSPNGLIYIANRTGQDDGQTYSGAVLPLFDDLGSPASTKIPTVGRAVVRASAKINDQIEFHSDFDLALPPAPNAAQLPEAASIWDVGIWGTSVWGADLPSVISQDWRSLGGEGYAASMSLQITSGAIQPLDAEIIRLDMMFTTAEMVT